LFGWESKDAMSIGEIGDYKFLDHWNQRIGAVSPVLAQGASPAWTYYFQVVDIDIAAAKTGACGGKVIH
jgi:predicted enzyme related to lactoylglutathione lyase